MYEKKIRSIIAGYILAMAAVYGEPSLLQVYGAESSVIENVSVILSDNYGEPEEILEPTIKINGTNCVLEDFQYRTDLEKWKPGKKVRIEITVKADKEKIFPISLNSSQCKVSGASFVSARALEDSKLQVKVDYKPVSVLGNTSWAGWDRTERRKAVWKPVKYTTGYSLILYGDNKVIKRLKVNGTSADLSDYMKNDDKTYYYEVKAIPTTSEEKKYLKEGIMVSSTEDDYSSEEWNDDTDDGGYIRGSSYILPDGYKDVNCWKKVSGRWYYFDQSGVMAKGWHYINNHWYYMNDRGIMLTGWVNPAKDNWFYLSDNGDMLIGWIQPQPGAWYYLDENGYMKRGWVLVNNKWYYLNSDGKMLTGWVNPSEDFWFYTTANGDMCTGWIQPQPGAWYYLDGNGYMQRGWIFVNDKWYYLNSDGKMLTGWVMVSDVWYFLYNDGSMAVNTSVDGWTISASGAAYQ